jgi:hypothetical protein
MIIRQYQSRDGDKSVPGTVFVFRYNRYAIHKKLQRMHNLTLWKVDDSSCQIKQLIWDMNVYAKRQQSDIMREML